MKVLEHDLCRQRKGTNVKGNSSGWLPEREMEIAGKSGM